MVLSELLRTSDLARAAGISVQQVRNYEAQGLLPPAERNRSGYRLYTRQHLVALKTVRSMLGGYGWILTPKIIQAIHLSNLPEALALIDERHAELARQRSQLEQTLAALTTLAEQPPPPAVTHRSRGRNSGLVRVGEAARQVGVQVSALHFWEQQGLLQPVRDRFSRYRLYDEQQMQRLRVVVLLRKAGYNFEVIRTTLDELAAGQPEKAIAAVERRRAEVARVSWVCLGGISAFQQYVSEFWGNPDPDTGIDPATTL